MDQRQQQLQRWLQNIGHLSAVTLEPLRADASFRRYFRVQQNGRSFVVMDAPPERETNTQTFVTLARILRAEGVMVPQILAEDVAQGFLLLSDFGDTVYLQALANDNADELYATALQALAHLQGCPTLTLPVFSAEFMYQELQLAKEWFLQKHLGLVLTSATEKMLGEYFYFLAHASAAQPQVFMHRDFQSANLLVLPNQQVGILDFQDAFLGPITYDLVSLLRDCYVAWPTAWVQRWVLQYKNSIPILQSVADEEFLQWFDIMGMQRHLKALLTFSRKFHRDNNPDYLVHMPRTLNYLLAVAPNYAESVLFYDFMMNTVMPQFTKVSTTCEQ